jgi:hypothetical protein
LGINRLRRHQVHNCTRDAGTAKRLSEVSRDQAPTVVPTSKGGRPAPDHIAMITARGVGGSLEPVVPSCARERRDAFGASLALEPSCNGRGIADAGAMPNLLLSIRLHREENRLGGVSPTQLLRLGRSESHERSRW